MTEKLIQKGIEKGLISFNEDRKNITYIHQNKRRNFNNPEEQVQAETFLKLVLEYSYPVGRIQQFISVTMGSSTKEADIIVYSDDACLSPFIVVECKKSDITEAEFTQAIEQGFSYAHATKAPFLWVTEGTKENFYNVSDYPAMEREENKIADLPHYGKSEISNHKFAKGGKDGVELKIIEQSELTQIFRKAHDALWSGGKRNESEAFDEFDKLIFCKISDELKHRPDGEPYDFQILGSDSGNANLLNRIKSIYAEGKLKDPNVFKDDLNLTIQELYTVVGYLAPVNVGGTDLDSKGRAFETFLGGLFKGKFGAFFTPRPVVEFVIACLPIKRESKVLDTSCGSGGFLLYALDKVRKQADNLYPDYKTNVQKVGVHRDYWHNFAAHNLFGIEINNQISRTAKMNMIIHDDGHTNVISMDGLRNPLQMVATTNITGFKKDGFDFIATNPPFGSVIKNTAVDYMGDYELGSKDIDRLDVKLKNINPNKKERRDNQSTEILFIEQCYNFLNVGGILAMVIPDSILTNSSSQYVRDWIEEHYRIIAIVSLPQTTFTATGAGVKSSVIFLKKYSDSQTAQIRKLKDDLFDSLFEKDHFGLEIERLEKEKARLIKNGDATCQQIEADLKNFLAALKHQGTLTAETQKSEEKKAKEQRKTHETTEVFATWKKELSDEYNEKIKAVKEALDDEFIEQVKKQLTDYPIFMAIAENIGYDATGNEISQNDLPKITDKLRRFIEIIEKDGDVPVNFWNASI